jgi:hypothetical protein
MIDKNSDHLPLDEAPAGEPRKELSPAARRALEEAAARRAQAEALARAEAPKELGGRSGPDPVRYGDWEKGGIISDF